MLHNFSDDRLVEHLPYANDEVDECLLTVFIVGDGDGDDVPNAHHCTAPVVTKRCPKMHLEFLLRFKNRVVVDVNCAVLHLEKRSKKLNE